MVRKTDVWYRNISNETRVFCIDVVETCRAHRTCNFIYELTQI